MSDTPKLDFEERQRAQQVYEECCENPEDFAYNFVALQGELAAAQEKIAELERCYKIWQADSERYRTTMNDADKRIAELERIVHDLAGAAWRLDKRQCLRTDHLDGYDEEEADHIIDVLRVAIDAARKEGR